VGWKRVVVVNTSSTKQSQDEKSSKNRRTVSIHGEEDTNTITRKIKKLRSSKEPLLAWGLDRKIKEKKRGCGATRENNPPALL